MTPVAMYDRDRGPSNTAGACSPGRSRSSRLEVHDLIAIPLAPRGEVIGVLHVLSARRPEPIPTRSGQRWLHTK